MSNEEDHAGTETSFTHKRPKQIISDILHGFNYTNDNKYYC